MKKFPIILDLETKHTFREFDDAKKLGITVVAVYDYKDNSSRVYTEKDLNELFSVIENASYIVGYNVRSFDMAVLGGYYYGDVTQLSVFDMLEDIREKIGRRLALNDLIKATLNKGKTGHGLQAIELYKEGKWDELKQYCADDVKLTKELFDYGIEHGEVFYLNEIGKTSIKVSWKQYLEGSGGGNMSLTLPF